MARGFISGALIAGAFSLGAAGIVSVVVPLPAPTQPPQDVVQSPAQVEKPTPVVQEPTEQQSSEPETTQVSEATSETSVVETADVVAEEPTPDPDQEPETETLTVVDQAEADPAPEAEEVAQAPQVSDAAPSEVSAPVVNEASPDPVRSEVDTAPAIPATGAQVAAPAADAPAAVDTAAIKPVAAPQTEAATNLQAPQSLPNSADVALRQEDPVLPNPQALAPIIPQAADGVTVTTKPADRPSRVDTPVAEPAPLPDTQVAAVESATPDVTPAPDAPAAQVQQPQTDIAPVDPPAAVTRTENPESEDTEVAILTPTAPRQIGTPAISLTERSSSVVVNRLGTRIEDATEEDVTVITDAGTDATPGDPRPLIRYAQTFANPENKPLMSVVLIDDGSNPTSGAPGIAALRAFPYTLSFAVDARLPDAAERMALYRREGFEVLAMVDLPDGALPSDVETTLGAILPQMREVVGVLEGTEGGLQVSREVSDQVTAILAQSGHGLVTQDKGLNTMPKLARKEGVPADPIFRDFDSKGQTATVIRRFLDQAAFKAGREGAVIMLGRLRPDTISALLLWGLQDRAGQVALAPISAVLTREEGS